MIWAIPITSNRAGNRDIWVMNADGSGAEQLTTSLDRDEDPSWSPDGTKIAFTSERTGNKDIWVVDVASKVETRLTTAAEDDYAPSWGMGP